MSHSHAAHEYDVVVGRVPRLILLAALVCAGVGTVFGLWHLWPDPADAPDLSVATMFAAPGVTFPRATVVEVQSPCPLTNLAPEGQPPDVGFQPSPDCGNIKVRLVGADQGARGFSVQVPPEVSRSGLRAGDTVQLEKIPATEGQPALYSYSRTDRHVSLLWMALAFAVVVVAVARLRGLMALIGLAFSAFMVVKFMLPALLAGSSGLWVAVTGASAIMFVVLYSTHGPSLRTSSALAGTLLGIVLTAGFGLYAIDSTRLTGISDESGTFLSSFASDLDFSGLLTCGLIIAGLGVLNDVTITQSSAVWELRSAAPEMPRRRVFTSAMRIGRDHIASTIYTIVFAYAGASISLLLLLVIYHQPVQDLISSEGISEEVVRTLASGLGLVLAVPITTAIAAAVASPTSTRAAAARPPDDRPLEEQFWKPRKSWW
jgi:uncharacterized membrane protein